MQAHEAGAEPEHIGYEERGAPGNAAPVLALDEIHGHEWKDDESAPIKPMGQHKRKAWHLFPRKSPRLGIAAASDLIEGDPRPAATTPEKRTAARRARAAAA